MANKTIEQLKAEAAVVRDATEEKENTALRIGTVLIDMIDTLSESVSINAIKGYVLIDSTSELPENPTPEQQQKGYLLNTTLYVYVGTGGDTLDGKYQSAQLKGADGAPGAPGEKGDKGDSGVDLGEVVLVNDLTTGGEGSALSAEMGKLIADTTMAYNEAETETLVPTFEQGPLDSNGAKIQQSQTQAWYQRIRAKDFIRVYGAFSITINSGYYFNAFWFTDDDESTYQGKIGVWTEGTYNGNFNGYIRINAKKGDAGTADVTPSDVTVTMIRSIPAGYAPRILDRLDSTATDFALSANQGKVIGDNLFGLNGIMPLLQGGVNADGTRMSPDNASYPNRVVSPPLKVNGVFSVQVGPQGYWNIHFYTEAGDDVSQIWQTEGWFDAASQTTYTGNWYGYMRVLYKKTSAGTTACTPSDFSLTLNAHGVTEKVNDLDNTCVVELEQGALSTAYPNQEEDSLTRVRSGFYEVHGEFRISGRGQKIVFLYDENKIWQNRVSDVTDLTWVVDDLVFSHNGYIRIGCRKDANSSQCTPSDFYITLTNPIQNRVADIEKQLQVIGDPLRSYERNYLGEKIVIQQNKYAFSTYCTLPIGLNQCMAVNGDYVFIFSITTTVASCKIYDISSMTLLATLNLPNSTYMRPHCNSASFSNVFNTANSIVPLLYVSQWENDGQKCCFVYDFKLTNGTYSVDLVQTILPTNVNTATRGAGQTDWVVDPLGYIYSIGYLVDNGATVTEDNKTMICKYRLPAIADGAVVTFGDADVLDHFDVKIYTARQDVIFNNGRILMITGVPANSQHGLYPCRFVGINPSAQAITTVLSLDEFNQEPEGIGITKDGHLVIGFRDNKVLYRFDFI